MKEGSFLLGLFWSALLPATGCEKRKAAKPRLGEVERLPRVETAVLGKPAKLEVARTYTVTLEAMEKADLCAMVTGNVKDLPEELDRGKVVTKGKLLFSLHVPDLIADYENKKALVEQFEKADALAIRSVDVAKAEVRETRALVLRYEGDAEYRRAQSPRFPY